MTEQPLPTTGRFVWHDLMTTDLARSLPFFQDLFGWRVQQIDTGDPPYRMIHLADRPIGGVLPLDPATEIPSHWIGYVATDDLDGLMERIGPLGGAIRVPITPIQGTGRFAVVGDPTGGTVSLLQLDHPEPRAPGMTPPGDFHWDELLAANLPAARAFYTGLFGWTVREQDLGEAGTYHIFIQGDTEVAGMIPKPHDAPGPSAWLSHIRVRNVDESLSQAESLGAQVFVRPREIPNIGRFTVLQDPAGAAFAMFAPAS